MARRRQDAEKIFAEAEAEKMTGSGYAWIVTEQAIIKFSLFLGDFFWDFYSTFSNLKKLLVLGQIKCYPGVGVQAVEQLNQCLCIVI